MSALLVHAVLLLAVPGQGLGGVLLTLHCILAASVRDLVSAAS